MSYRDSSYDRPLDNPINWSFRVGRLFGIDIRVHIAFVICAVILVWMEIPDKDSGISWSLGRVLFQSLGTYAILFAIVLVHEFGHCFGARYTGGEAEEILMWPLGGLASVNPPHNAKAHMITTVAGPLVNVAICAICSAALVLWMGRLGAVPWNPLHPFDPVSSMIPPTIGQWWLLRVYGLSYFLLLINLLPIFPFDGGRIVQAWLWPKKGFRRSMEIATGTGMIGAVLIGLFGLFIEESWLLLMIAVFGYMNCYQIRRMLKEQGEFAGDGLGEFSDGFTFLRDADGEEKKPGFFARRRTRREAKKAEQERQLAEAHDRAVEDVLRKVSASGIDTLTARERRILEEETRRQRMG
ncbi:MAG: hypothetical protein IIC02_03005 [Planctomycetes bacterium]|nr:hypothetical protein [Planctomycetota bacterium]